MYFSFEDLPEVVQDQLRTQAAQMEMATDDFGHGIIRLMTEQDQDTLQTFKSMMHLLAHSSNSPLAAYWEGMTAMTLQLRFNICAAHGVNHDEEIHAAMGTGEKPTGDQAYVMPDTGKVVDSPPVRLGNEQITPASFSPTQRRTMEQYHVDDCYDDETKTFKGFICTGIVGGPVGGCGTIYQSLEDRMVKEPEDCSGCHQRAAHG